MRVFALMRLLLCYHGILLVAKIVPFVEGQEAPRYPVETVEPHRTDFCERHNLVESGINTRRNALKGMEISVALYPYQLENGVISKNDPGIGILFLDEIAARAGFTWRNNYGVHPTPSGNVTWNDVLYRTNMIYDVAGEWYWRTVHRMSEGVLFPEGFYDGSFIMVGIEHDFVNSDTFDLWAFMAPFSSEVWFLVLGTIIASAMVFYLIQYLENANNLMNPYDSLFVTAFSFTGHYFFLPRTNAARIFSFSICALALMMGSAYTANLASFLVLLNQPASKIGDLRDAVALDQRICVYATSPPHDFMLENFPSAKLVPVVDDQAAFMAIDAGECGIALTTVDAWESAKTNAEVNEDCNKKWIGRVAKFQQAGFPIGDSQGLCTSLLRDVVEIIMIDMKADGTFDRIWMEHRAKRNTNSCDSADDTDEKDQLDSFRLNLNSVGGMFIFYAGALVVSILFAFQSSWISYPEREHPKRTEAVTSQLGDIMTRRGMHGNITASNTTQASTPSTPKPARLRRQMTDGTETSHSQAGTSRYTDKVFGEDSILFSMEMHSARAIPTRSRANDSDSLMGLYRLLEQKEVRDKQWLEERDAQDKQWREEINLILSKVSKLPSVKEKQEEHSQATTRRRKSEKSTKRRSGVRASFDEEILHPFDDEVSASEVEPEIQVLPLDPFDYEQSEAGPVQSSSEPLPLGPLDGVETFKDEDPHSPAESPGWKGFVEV